MPSLSTHSHPTTALADTPPALNTSTLLLQCSCAPPPPLPPSYNGPAHAPHRAPWAAMPSGRLPLLPRLKVPGHSDQHHAASESLGQSRTQATPASGLGVSAPSSPLPWTCTYRQVGVSTLMTQEVRPTQTTSRPAISVLRAYATSWFIKKHSATSKSYFFN